MGKRMAAIMLLVLLVLGAMPVLSEQAYQGSWVEFADGGFKLWIPSDWKGSDLTELLQGENRAEVDVMSIYGDAALIETVNIICWNSIITDGMPIAEIEEKIDGLDGYEGDVGTVNGLPAIYYPDIGDNLSAVYLAYGDKLISIAGGPLDDASYQPIFFQIVRSFTPLVS